MRSLTRPLLLDPCWIVAAPLSSHSTTVSPKRSYSMWILPKNVSIRRPGLARGSLFGGPIESLTFLASHIHRHNVSSVLHSNPYIQQPQIPNPSAEQSNGSSADFDGSACELGLLSPEGDAPILGEHEIKTAPLVTRDVANLSRSFVQRGLLGKVLSVHADDIPSKTKDPRIYMNLNAPSSGLVCGVQGSGKSHTVSCIMEASLMTDKMIGSLPSPLATIVFHFDEENGGRPCEAAFLGEYQDSKTRAVKEVVVLVSPNNLKRRRSVYAELKYVRVEPLRIAEGDLNAARMLSMMGADNLENMPLYMHTALSILRDIGSDNFSYKDFRDRLSSSKFDNSQLMMLQLRLDLLDSFLQGKGKDVSSFFKPGRLVIIDLSDPFVNATTAALLFDICLGLFIERKTLAGKLIVLDEAHKYLTNSDSNRFTRTICSVIRQRRHLAARVIVSTQEPTVVPSSVLDLLSWVVCHRFSSPSWVKHLSQHLCVKEEASSGASDWGKRVMALKTGEALLCSAASLFLSSRGDVVSLVTGYAIIKTRARLTRDGGKSLLASDLPASEPLTTSKMGTATSESVPSTPLILSQNEPKTAPGLGSTLLAKVSESSNTGKRRSKKATSIVAHGSAVSSIQLAPPEPAERSSDPVVSAPQNLLTGNKKAATAPLASPSTSTISSSGNTSSEPTPASIASFQILIDAMKWWHMEKNSVEINLGPVAIDVRKLDSSPRTKQWKAYMKEAENKHIVRLSTHSGGIYAALHPVLLDHSMTPISPVSLTYQTSAANSVVSKGSDSAESEPSPSSSSSNAGTSSSLKAPRAIAQEFRSLLSVINRLAPNHEWVKQDPVGGELAKLASGSYRHAGYKRLTDFLVAAETSGYVARRKGPTFEVRLLERLPVGRS